jgi:hypothetical protein
MSTILVLLDPSDQDFNSMQREINNYLTSLETVSFRTEARPGEPGKLAGEEDIFKFLIENSAAIIELITAIMLIAHQVKASGGSDSPKKSRERDNKSVVIEVGDKRISIPASEATRRKFLKLVESDLRGNKQQVSAGKPAKRGK